jgi:serine/threonine protein kinase
LVADIVRELLVRWDEKQAGTPAELCRPYADHPDYPELLAALKNAIADPNRTSPLFPPTTPDASQSFSTVPLTPDVAVSPNPPQLDEAVASPPVGLRYQTVAAHKKGGLGEVLVADDTELHRKVALKRMRLDRYHDTSSRREFLREAEITARLEHPGIVPVHGLVHDADGQPYYAMRFIEGETLSDAIKRFHEADANPGRDAGERSLALRELLNRFIGVCNTVAYAHSRGVLHRDLKPQNVMLGKYGETLVVDWGMAKPFSRPEEARARGEEAVLAPFTQQEDHETRAGVVKGTPTCMSPEQASGRIEEISPASDIFALGATLYAILTGFSPYYGSEALRRAKHAEFSPPRQVNPQTPRPLEASCLKAMAFKPEDRYATAKALADDVDKWLADEPVMAYRDSRRERAGRWIRRHRVLMTSAAATLVLALVGSTVGLLWLAAAERRERVLRQTAQEKEQEALDEQAKSEKAASAERVANETAQKAAKAEKLANGQAQKRLKQIEKGAEILASVFHDLDPNSEEREGESLRVLLGKHLGKAVKDLEGEAVGDPEIVALLQALLGKSLRDLGHYDQAETVLTNAQRSLEISLGRDDPASLSAMQELAKVYSFQCKYAAAEALFKEVLQVRTAKLEAGHPVTLVAKHNLALLYRLQGRNAEAEMLFNDLLQLQTTKLGADHRDTLITKKNLGDLYHFQAKYGQAETLLKEVLNIQTAQLGADHPETLLTQNSLALVYQFQRKNALAEALFKEAVAGLTAKLGDDHPSTLTTKCNLAMLYEDERTYPQAEMLLKEVLAGQTAKLGADHPDTMGTKNRLGVVYWKMNKLDRSIRVFEEMFEHSSKKLGADHPNTLSALANLGINYCDAGRLEEGIRSLEAAMAGFYKLPDPKPAQLTWIPTAVAETYDRAKQYAKSERLYRAFLQQGRKQFGDDDPRTAGLMAQLAVNLLAQKKHADAETTLRDCLAIRARRQPDDWPTFNAKSMLGEALLGQEKPADAEPLLKEAYAGLRQRQDKIPEPVRQLRLTEALARMVQLYKATGNKEEADKWGKELEAAKAKVEVKDAKKP